MMTILVTGAGGLVGGTIVEALHFSQKYRVRAAISRWTSAPRIARLAIDLAKCDVMKPDDLAAATVGVDAIIHCAVSDDPRVTINGTENVLNAARKAGIKRVVFFSSVAVYGQIEGAITENMVPERTQTEYGAAKWVAENLCHANSPLEVVILRPTIIYGPFSSRWTTLNALRLRSGRWKLLDTAGDGYCNLIHVHDVARYAIAAAHIDGLAGETFNINGPDQVSWNDYFTEFNRQLKLPPLRRATKSSTTLKVQMMAPIRSVGKYVLKHHATKLRWLARKNSRLQRLMQDTELMLKCTPNADELALFKLNANYVSAKAEAAFGFCAQIKMTEGIAMSVAWLNHMGDV